MDQPRTTGITDEGEAHLRSILATVPDAMVVRATGERKNIHAELSVIEAGVDTRDEDVISDTLVARARAIDAPIC